MKHLSFLLIAVFVFSLAIFGCKDDDKGVQLVTPDTTQVDTTMERKPNIYIYPKEDAQLQVKIVFPRGGKVTESIPSYKDGWNVSVTPDGIIDGSYSYLYYENEMPDYTQRDYGWVVKKADLQNFFEDNMKESGFNSKEIADFTEYWIPRLISADYYEIYPQYIEDLQKMSMVKFTPKPDNVYRLSYAIEESANGEKHLKEPDIQKAKRVGSYVVVWGVIKK